MPQVTRLSKHLTKRELSLLKKALKPYGAKIELSRRANVAVPTIYNILKTGRGLAQNVDAVRQYLATNVAA